uniref:Outer membrane efflux protein, putative n=1 Tax=Chlorobium chlorochromatii (strain CaD3) TaxID=340177 RepID=Q3ASX5_CHLCH
MLHHKKRGVVTFTGKQLLVVVLLFLLPFAGVQGAENSVVKSGNAVTLEEALQIGLQRNRTLEVARLDRDIAHQKIRETWADVLPKLTLSGTYTRSLKPSVLLLPPNPLFPSGELQTSSDNAAFVGLDLRQPLFNASAMAGIRAANIVRSLSDASYRKTEMAVLTDIKLAYYDVLIAREQVKLIEQSIARWEQSRRDTRALFRQGIAADIDTLKAFLSVENLRPDFIQAESRVASAMTTLKNLMGVPADSAIVLSGKLELPSGTKASYPATTELAAREAFEQRPDLRQIALQADAEAENVNSLKAERYPLLSLFGKLEAQTSFNDGINPSESRWPVSSSAGVQLSLPLFTGYRTSARIEQATLSRRQTLTRLEEQKASVRAELETALLHLHEAQQRIEVQSKTIAVAERSYTISRLRFREGIGSRLELSDAELQLVKARTNYLQAVYDYLVATTRLDKSLGRRSALLPLTR